MNLQICLCRAYVYPSNGVLGKDIREYIYIYIAGEKLKI